MAARSGKLRQRGSDNKSSKSSETDNEHTQAVVIGKRKFLGEHVCFLLLISYFVFFGLVSWGHRRLPAPKTTAEYNTGDLTFIEQRAYTHLKKLTSLGPRPAGSRVNEEKAVAFILKELNRVKSSAKHHHRIDIDVQKPDGSFAMNMGWGGMTHYYKHVTNIVVRLGSAKRAKGRNRALLVNAHFDSVVGSPGASDDAISCAVMLELLEVLSKTTFTLNHDLILLFNGAEENILPSAHGFITQHPWAKDIDAFINLEAAGAGGRELVFQTGPEHPWLVKAYSDHAVHPYAASIAQEIFQANLIPSDTDYRVFRDFGHIPGIDIAFVSNGFVYHTRYDNLESITPGSIQRAGDNVLHVVTNLLTTDTMDRGLKEDRHGKMVFFDVIGLFMVTVPTSWSAFLIWAFISIAFGVVWLRRKEGFHGKPYMLNVFQAVLVILLSWIAALLAIVCMGGLVTLFHRKMFWYSNPGPILGVYAAPALYSIIRVQRSMGIRMHRNLDDKTSNPWLAECMFYDAHLILWSLMLGLMAFVGIAAAYLPFFWVVFPLLGRQIIWSNMKTYRDEVMNDYTVLSVYLVSVAFPVVMSFYHLYFGMEVFIPIMGRSGSELNPEIFIGGFAFLGVTLSTSYVTSLIQTFKTLKYTRAFLLGLFLTSSIAMFTSLGFPYSGDPLNPAPKRFFVQHTSRTFHNELGYVRDTDSFLILVPSDQLGIAPLFDYIPVLMDAPELPCEMDAPYCGLPYLLPFRNRLKTVWSLPAGPPEVAIPVEVQLVSRVEDKHQTNFTFTISGPCHMTAYVSPRDNVTMTKWSLSDVLPKRNSDGNGGYTYFIYFGGGRPNDTWPMWLSLETSPSHVASDPILDIAFAGQYRSELKHAPEVKDFMRLQPDWIDTIPLISTYFSWTY